jgi:predicted N-acyltransferase
MNSTPREFIVYTYKNTEYAIIKSILSYENGSGAQDKPWRGFRDDESTFILTSPRPPLLF